MIKITDQLVQSDTIGELSKALVAFNGLFQTVSLKKDARNNRNQYVTLDNLINTVRPLLTEVGLFITQDLAGDYLSTTIMHESGEFRTSLMPFNPMDGKGINSLQAIGGGITYAKRYALSAVLNISVDTDDDAATTGHANTRPKQKPNMYPGHKLWEAVVDKIKTGKTTVEGVQQFYSLTLENKRALSEIQTNAEA